MQRYFSKEKINEKLVIDRNDYHHIFNVMRMKENDQIEVVYDEKVHICRIKIENDKLYAKIIKISEINVNNKDVTLIIPLLKEAKMDLILGKATELGVNGFIPYFAERSIIKLDEKKIKNKFDRWNKIIKEASEQSKRITIPKIEKIYSLKDVSEVEGLNVICSTVEKKKNIKTLLQNSTNYDKINIIVGPEGGFTTKEEKFLIEHHFKSVTLGNLIMRVETVPIFLMSVINYENME